MDCSFKSDKLCEFGRIEIIVIVLCGVIWYEFFWLLWLYWVIRVFFREGKEKISFCLSCWLSVEELGGVIIKCVFNVCIYVMSGVFLIC